MWGTRQARTTGCGRALLAAAALLASAGPAAAHWCSNIYDGPARLVVKPEQSTVFPGDSGTLRVWVRNNFPYVTSNTELRASNSDFNVSITPNRVDLYPGQEVAFDLTITRVGSSGDNDLRLEIRIFDGTAHSSSVKNWRDAETDFWTNPAPSESTLRGALDWGQSRQLNAGTLAELYSVADGEAELLEMYGRPRLQYTNTGAWADGNWLPDRTPDKFDFQLLRAGVELAIRRSTDPATLTAIVNAMDDPNEGHRGASALLGGYMLARNGANAAVLSRLQQMAASDPCVNQDLCTHYAWSSSDRVMLMGKAGLLLAGQSQYQSEVQAGLTHSNDTVKMICSAALGLLGDDAAVTGTLQPLAQDDFGWIELFAPYLMQLLAVDRRGGLGGTGCVTFYGEVCDDDVPPRPPENLQVVPAG